MLQNSMTARSPRLPACPTCGGHVWRDGVDPEALIEAELRAAFEVAVKLFGRRKADDLVAAIGASAGH
jgi:hypothetical protein